MHKLILTHGIKLNSVYLLFFSFFLSTISVYREIYPNYRLLTFESFFLFPLEDFLEASTAPSSCVDVVFFCFAVFFFTLFSSSSPLAAARDDPFFFFSPKLPSEAAALSTSFDAASFTAPPSFSFPRTTAALTCRFFCLPPSVAGRVANLLEKTPPPNGVVEFKANCKRKLPNDVAWHFAVTLGGKRRRVRNWTVAPVRDDVACGARAIGGVWIALNCNYNATTSFRKQKHNYVIIERIIKIRKIRKFKGKLKRERP